MKILFYLLFLTTISCQAKMPNAISISENDFKKIGQKIWMHECGGTVSGLTSWNKNEDFASLGIGHFIWFHKNTKAKYEESFPKLIRFYNKNYPKIKTPKWANGSCPWLSKAQFDNAKNSPRMRELRNFLKNTVEEQTAFIVNRLVLALPKMESALSSKQKEILNKNFNKMLSSPAGTYAMIDYVNFKGEGTNPAEKYKGKGWGLKQVLLNMDAKKPKLIAFSNSAQKMLLRRIKNAPRQESQWQKGWLRRCASYTKF